MVMKKYIILVSFYYNDGSLTRFIDTFFSGEEPREYTYDAKGYAVTAYVFSSLSECRDYVEAIDGDFKKCIMDDSKEYD